MPANSLLEKSSYVQCLQPDAYTAATHNGDSVAIANFRKAEVILDLGDMVATSTVAVKVQYSTDNGATFADLLGEDGSTVVAMSTKTQAGGDDNTTYRGLLYLTELPSAGVTHIRAVATVANAASDFGVGIRLGEPYEAPVVADVTGNEFYAIHGVGAR